MKEGKYMSKILVIGSLNIDLVIETPVIPILGETVLGSGFMTAPGGKGANQAVAAARLGGDVSMVGCIGNDIFGKELINNLIKNNVNVDEISIINEAPTGVAMIVVKDGNNFIIVNSGANFSLNPDIVKKIEHRIRDCSILVLQHEIPYDSVERAIEIAKRYGVKVLLNPAPAKAIPDKLLPLIDIITPNEFECEYITGLPVKSIDDAKKAIECFKGKGIKQVIITMGGRGVVYNSGDEIIHKPVPKVQVVDTTAAGDSFTGAIAVALSEGKDIDQAVDFANMVGTLTVTKRGAQTSLPMREDVEKFGYYIQCT